MTLEYRINTFSELGNFLNQFSNNTSQKNKDVYFNDLFFDKFLNLIHSAQHKNGWFLPEQVFFSVSQWANALKKENLKTWTAQYSFNVTAPKTVSIVMAGNIPLVGFHDLLCVLISGHKVVVKTSSDDDALIPFLCDYLCEIAPDFKKHISFTKGKLENFDAVIATGSNNTARYFEYYFKSKPHIIRKNRNSIAILTGNETQEELIALGEDIFRYYGLGCRSVSKLFVPKNYNFDDFFNAMYHYKELIEQEKYCNNYDYNKAVYLMSNYKLLDNGFLILKEDESYSSPISSIFYEFYDTILELENRLNSDSDLIQCIVNYSKSSKNVAFGATQTPKLNDYADGIDTVDFLLKI